MAIGERLVGVGGVKIFDRNTACFNLAFKLDPSAFCKLGIGRFDFQDVHLNRVCSQTEGDKVGADLQDGFGKVGDAVGIQGERDETAQSHVLVRNGDELVVAQVKVQKHMHGGDLERGDGKLVATEVERGEIERCKGGWELVEKVVTEVNVLQEAHSAKGVRERGELVTRKVELLERGHTADDRRERGEKVAVGNETLHQHVVTQTRIEALESIKRYVNDTERAGHGVEDEVGNDGEVHFGQIEHAQFLGVVNGPVHGVRHELLLLGHFGGALLARALRFALCAGGLLRGGGLFGGGVRLALGARGGGVEAVLNAHLVDGEAGLVRAVVYGVVELEVLDLFLAGELDEGGGWRGGLRLVLV